MGTPTNPSLVEREARQKLAAAIVQYICTTEAAAESEAEIDEIDEMPLLVDFDASVGNVREQVEQLAAGFAHEITTLMRENAALTEVYATAARLRTFPVPFNDHFALVGAVDECRSVVEPPIDDSPYAPSEHPAANPSAWQQRVAAYPREEFLAMFRQAHAVLHQLWTSAVDKEDYDKSLWKLLDNALARFARDAAEGAGIGRTEPLL